MTPKATPFTITTLVQKYNSMQYMNMRRRLKHYDSLPCFGRKTEKCSSKLFLSERRLAISININKSY